MHVLVCRDSPKCADSSLDCATFLRDKLLLRARSGAEGGTAGADGYFRAGCLSISAFSVV